ncbi:FkbM family methyltransferase [Amorphus sp. MBR-141]
MYENFQWTRISTERNALTLRFEPIQPYLLRTLARSLNEALVFDIGANIGVYAILLGDLDSVAEVRVFEPMDDCIVEIERNIALNQMTGKVAIHKIALSDRSGHTRFRKISDYSGGNGITETHLFKNLAFEGEDTVPIEPLDTLVDAEGRDIVLKIDVEGHEHKVLIGAERLLAKNSGIVQIEIHENAPDARATKEFLERLGYTKLLRVGWDYYYSNRLEHQSETGRIEAIENALSYFVEYTLQREVPARRDLLEGVTIELSRKRADHLKKMLAGWRRPRASK